MLIEMAIYTIFYFNVFYLTISSKKAGRKVCLKCLAKHLIYKNSYMYVYAEQSSMTQKMDYLIGRI